MSPLDAEGEQPRSHESPDPDPDARLKRALLIEQVRGPDDAIVELLALAEAHRDHAATRFGLGRLLITHRRDDAGIEHLERAMELDVDTVEPSCHLLHGHFRSTNRHERAEEVVKRFDAHQKLLEKAEAERATLDLRDVLLPHDLPPEEIARIVEALSPIKGVVRIYLALKKTRLLPQKPAYCLVLEHRRSWWVPVSVANILAVHKKVGEVLTTERPMNVWVFDRGQGPADAKLLKRLSSQPGLMIYDASRSGAAKPSAAKPGAARTGAA